MGNRFPLALGCSDGNDDDDDGMHMTALSEGTAPARGPAATEFPSAEGSLSVGGILVAEYPTGADLSVEHSPRPYLHPLRSLAGVDLTEIAPADHPHHYGVSLAVADVNGTSYWGGRTYVRDTGSTLLANHGHQQSLHRTGASAVPTGQLVAERLLWRDQAGAVQLNETRTIRARPLPDGSGWTLTWTSLLDASGAPVRIGSPATNGRANAGYGGIFWRLPNRPGTRVLTSAGEGEALAHGSLSPWLALNQRDGDRRVSLLLTQPAATARPWFVRATEYVGAGPMLAAESVLTIEPGATLAISLAGVVLDRWVEDAADAERILAAAGLAGADAAPAQTGPAFRPEAGPALQPENEPDFGPGAASNPGVTR